MKRILCVLLTLLLLSSVSALACKAPAKPAGQSTLIPPETTLISQQALVIHQRLAALAAQLFPQPNADSFASQLFTKTESPDLNKSLSPVSAQFALGLLRPGTAGETRAQLDALLDGVNFTAWKDALQTQADGPTIEVANSVWFDTSVTPNRTYLNTLKQEFAAESTILPLPGESALKPINQWVSEKTHGLIPTILSEPLPKESAAVLLNTLYFNGNWVTPFSQRATREQPFHAQDGTAKMVPFLHDTRHELQYIKTPVCTGAALPYQGDGSWWMLVLLPSPGVSPEALASQDFGTLLDQAKPTYTRLSLPKFTLEGSYPLKEPLKAMGLTAPFIPTTPDLAPTGTCSKGPLFVMDVFQKTCLRVDEKGTEAAAVTGITEGASAEPPIEEPIDLTFDRPFLCCLWNDEIGQPLFLSAINQLG